MKELMPSLSLAALVLGVTTFIALTPSEKGAVFAVFPPQISGNSFFEAIDQADGVFLSKGRLPSTYVIWSDRAGLPDRLRAAGAVLVLNAKGGGICSSSELSKPLTLGFTK